MAEESTKKETNEEREPRLYELGYHLLPTIEESALSEKATFLRDQIEKLKGIVVGDQMPQLMTLSYSIPKIVNKKRKYFETAYFGSTKFRMSPELALAFEKGLKDNEDILRYILIKTLEEEIVPLKKMKFMKEDAVSDRSVEALVEEKKGKTLSEEELDETIKELVAD